MARKAPVTCPAGEKGVPVDVLEIDRFLPGLLQGSGKLVHSPVVIMFRPHASDLRESAVHGSEPSPLLSLKVT